MNAIASIYLFLLSLSECQNNPFPAQREIIQCLLAPKSDASCCLLWRERRCLIRGNMRTCSPRETVSPHQSIVDVSLS